MQRSKRPGARRRTSARTSTPGSLVGVSLLRTFEGHDETILSLAFNPDGDSLASGSSDGIVRIWNTHTGELLHNLEGHRGDVYSLSFAPSGTTLASGSEDETVRLWDTRYGDLVHEFQVPGLAIDSAIFHPDGQMLAIGGEGYSTVRLVNASTGETISELDGTNYASVYSLAFDAVGETLASAKEDGRIMLWHVATGEFLGSLIAHTDAVLSVAFDQKGRYLASGGSDGTIKIWDVKNQRLLRSLEVHTRNVDAVGFSNRDTILCSKSADGSLRLWDCSTWNEVGSVVETGHSGWIPGFAFHPKSSLLAVCARPTPEEESRLIHLWELNLTTLTELNKQRLKAGVIHHTTAKIVLVGDSGVGKTGLGWRLKYGEFKEHPSSHGQQFWVLDELGMIRDDGTECEAILWDLAGQPDYRLTHALFLDDADLALIVIDPTDSRDPVHGVDFWINQLRSERLNQSTCPSILVGARSDRGEARLTQDELDAFCIERGIQGGIL